MEKKAADEKTLDETAVPAKVTAAIASLVVMIGHFVIALTRASGR